MEEEFNIQNKSVYQKSCFSSHTHIHIPANDFLVNLAVILEFLAMGRLGASIS